MNPTPEPTPFTLIEDPVAGFLQVSPTPSIEALRDLYKHEYYVRDKPVYLEKSLREKPYWDQIWSLRLQAMVETLNGPGKILDVGASGGFFLNRARENRLAGSGDRARSFHPLHLRLNTFNSSYLTAIWKSSPPNRTPLTPYTCLWF